MTRWLAAAALALACGGGYEERQSPAPDQVQFGAAQVGWTLVVQNNYSADARVRIGPEGPLLLGYVTAYGGETVWYLRYRPAPVLVLTFVGDRDARWVSERLYWLQPEECVLVVVPIIVDQTVAQPC